MAKKGRRSTREEKLGAVTLIENGTHPDLVADIFNVSRSSVYDWYHQYREGGLTALSPKFASGRSTVLSDHEMIQLRSMIVGSDPRQYSLGMALWTRELVAGLIEQKFGKRLSLTTIGRILKKLGLSPQRPVYRAYQQDPEKVRIWREQTYPAIHAQAVQAGASIFFADEAGVRTDHHAGRTWAPIGRTPVVIATGERESVTMISAVSTHGQLHFTVFEGMMNASRFIEFCEKLLQDCPTPVFLIVDGHGAHTAKIVKEYVESTGGRLRLFFLPPYSPELNPDEWVWKNVKHDQIKRAVPMGKGHLWTLARDALSNLKNAPKKLLGFFGDPRLAYITALAQD
jgi:transposase